MTEEEKKDYDARWQAGLIVLFVMALVLALTVKRVGREIDYLQHPIHRIQQAKK
jgi:cytochrome c-type biogenesis protein CcmE